MPEFSEIIQIFKYFIFFMMGLIVGRVTMAIQIGVMKPKDADKPKNTDKQNVQQNNQPAQQNNQPPNLSV